jgi:hypothetical protein
VKNLEYNPIFKLESIRNSVSVSFFFICVTKQSLTKNC